MCVEVPCERQVRRDVGSSKDRVDEQDVEESPVEGGVDGDVRSELVEVRGDREGVDDAEEEGEGGKSTRRRLRARGTNRGVVGRGFVAVVVAAERVVRGQLDGHRRRRSHERRLQRLVEEEPAVLGVLSGAAVGDLGREHVGEEGVEPGARLGRSDAAEGGEDDGDEGAAHALWQPGRCLAFFSLARDSKISEESREAADT